MRCFLPVTDRPCTKNCAAFTEEGCVLLLLGEALTRLAAHHTGRRKPFKYPEPPEVGR